MLGTYHEILIQRRTGGRNAYTWKGYLGRQVFFETDPVPMAVTLGKWEGIGLIEEKKQISFLLLRGEGIGYSSCVHRGADCTQLLLLKNPPLPFY